MVEDCIVSSVKDHSSISLLPIPFCFKKNLRDKHLEFELNCTDRMPPIEEEEFFFRFDEPFVNIGVDAFLTIMRWDKAHYGVPDFAWEFTIIHEIFYEYDHGEWNNTERVCFNCIHDIYRESVEKEDKLIVTKWHHRDWSYDSDIIDWLQCTRHWCDRCHTTALFYFEPAPCKIRGGMFLMEVLAAYHFQRVNGKWRELPRQQ